AELLTLMRSMVDTPAAQETVQ
ncbi:TPA: hydrogenase-1 operon protein HyaE, partial [Salmonella enterica]|nr:hydrogenase-1 operon protein HyaE [Salmonella enterica]HCK8092541.1 hydrogenase-1 operon protein HyaE [Salmonella enterica]